MALKTKDLLHFLQGSDITGASSYDIWKSLNPEGTEQDFIDFLKAESAYETWLKQEGNEGKTEEEFIASLGGAKPEELTQVLTDAKKYTDDSLANFTGAETVVGTHNTATDAHNDIRVLINNVDTELKNFLNVSDTTKDQLSEVIALIEANAGTIESITNGKVNTTDIINNLTTNDSTKVLSAAQGVALKGLIDDLQTALNTDITNLSNHTSNTIVHITAQERTDWNDAVSKEHMHGNKTVLDNTTASYTTAEQTKLSGIATGAEVNQNAFSNIKVGSTTVVADNKTDTIEFVGSNVTITPDETNDKITFTVADGSTSAKGIIKLTDSVSSTDTTTAATPKNVKAAYDLANTAKTNAATAQTRADNAYSLAESKAESDHTHNYAGSSSVGGAATSANKLNTNAGSTTQPVFFENGIPKATSYTLGKSVPADAKFTDTVYTHPTSEVTAGTYKSVTVDGNGHVTAGSNPTTLSGYGITDAEAKGTATSTVNTHNTATDAHNDIRGLIAGLTTRLNTLANSDDTTLDQMSEVVAYIKSNRGLIEGVTTSKVGIDAIINNLTTNDSTKVLSAAQGVALKGLIDDLQTALNNEKTARETGDAQTLASAKSYTDEKISESLQSNYDLWLNLGYTGTPEDFINSLKGDSAYEIWLEQEGNAGKTKEEFFASMGFDSQLLTQTLAEAKSYTDNTIVTDFNEMTVKDTSGLLGNINASVNAQTLTDNIMVRLTSMENYLGNAVEELSKLV